MKLPFFIFTLDLLKIGSTQGGDHIGNDPAKLNCGGQPSVYFVGRKHRGRCRILNHVDLILFGRYFRFGAGLFIINSCNYHVFIFGFIDGDIRYFGRVLLDEGRQHPLSMMQ